MAKLTNKYDVVQMGDVPDFWSGIADRLEQYIDPEFQRKLRVDREEQRRYEDKTAKADKRYVDETNYTRQREAEETERLKQETIKADTQTEYDKFHNELQLSYEQGMGEEYRAELIDAAMYDMSFDTGNLKTGIDINKLDAMKEASLRNADYNKSWQTFMQNPNQATYDSLVSLANTQQQQDMIRQNADPKLEKVKLKQQYIEIAELMNQHLENPIDAAVLSQFTAAGEMGFKAAKDLFNYEIEQRTTSDEAKRELAKTLLSMEQDETMTDAEKQSILVMRKLGFQLYEEVGDVSKPGDEKIIKYKDKDGKFKEMKSGSARNMPEGHPAKQAWDKTQDLISDVDRGLSPRFDIAAIKDEDEVHFYGDKMTGRQFKSIYTSDKVYKWSQEELNNLKINRQNITFAGTAFGSPYSVPRKPQKFATKEDIDKAAKRLGFNDKVTPGTAKFESIRKKLESEFPFYNFGE